MKILSTFPKKRKRKVTVGFVGAYIPQSQSDYLTLYCSAFEVSKISIIKDFLTVWISKNMIQHSVSDLVKLNAEKAHSVWLKTEGQSFDSFLELLQLELENKKLPTDVVETILKLVKDEKNKSTKR